MLVALASPVTVGALALLVLNDHLLKQAWPGPVTGKLSDLAGLVVAPFLVALPLVVLRVRRPVPVAIVVTAVLFTLVKATDAGSDVASAALSAVAGLSLVRRDPTDLLALPALLVAARVHRLARVARPAGRRSALTVVGAFLLPFVVVATAATGECFPSGGTTDVGVVRGPMTGPDGNERVESRIVIGGPLAGVSVDAGSRVRRLTRLEEARIGSIGPVLAQVCDRSSRECWRANRSRPATVEHRERGGSWSVDFRLDRAERRAVRAEVGEECGRPAPLHVVDLTLLPTPRGPVVAAASSYAGVLLRSADGHWEHLTMEELGDLGGDSPPSPRPEDQITPLDRVPSPPSPTTPSPSPYQPPCASPSMRTVTPDPRNGPPTAYPVCPET